MEDESHLLPLYHYQKWIVQPFIAFWNFFWEVQGKPVSIWQSYEIILASR